MHVRLENDESASPAAVQRRLLRRLMAAAPFQPATNLWRSIEVPVLAAALPTEGRGLDVGCGDGALTGILRELRRADWTLVGLDPDPHEVAAARRAGLYEHVHNVTADRIPESDAAFDFVFANSVLEHIPILPDCLGEMARCLKPGGMFAATVPSPAFHRLLRGPGRLRRISREEYRSETDRRLAHVQYWPAERWREELRAVGFVDFTFSGYLSPAQTARWETWSNWTGGLLYRWRRQRQAPISIQRSLGLRRPLARGLGFLAAPLAWSISCGVLGDMPAAKDDSGCLLVVARKSERTAADNVPSGGAREPVLSAGRI